MEPMLTIAPLENVLEDLGIEEEGEESCWAVCKDFTRVLFQFSFESLWPAFLYKEVEMTLARLKNWNTCRKHRLSMFRESRLLKKALQNDSRVIRTLELKMSRNKEQQEAVNNHLTKLVMNHFSEKSNLAALKGSTMRFDHILARSWLTPSEHQFVLRSVCLQSELNSDEIELKTVSSMYATHLSKLLDNIKLRGYGKFSEHMFYQTEIYARIDRKTGEESAKHTQKIQHKYMKGSEKLRNISGNIEDVEGSFNLTVDLNAGEIEENIFYNLFRNLEIYPAEKQAQNRLLGATPKLILA